MDKGKLSSWIKLTDDFYLDPDGLLGKGCFGEVFRGYSMKLDSLIAIKTMQNEGYEREVETLKTLSSLVHPNIMGYYGFEEINGSIYIFIEFCPNGMLTDLITEGISEEEVLKLFRQLIEGMCYMNAKGNALPTQARCTEISSPTTSSSAWTRTSRSATSDSPGKPTVSS